MSGNDAVTYIQDRKAAFEIFHTYTYHAKPKVLSLHEDKIYGHTRGYGKATKPEDYLEEFKKFILENMNEIAALNIVCQRPKDLIRAEFIISFIRQQALGDVLISHEKKKLVKEGRLTILSFFILNTIRLFTLFR